MDQINLFNHFSDIIPETTITYDNVRSVGEKIGRVVLGECRIATITSVEGNGNFLFYRTTGGDCYDYAEGLRDIAELEQEAERNRCSYQTIIPEDLEECITVEFTSKHSGIRFWAQVGILNNMLFWKEPYSYQFLEPYSNPKKLRKEYKRHKDNILGQAECSRKFRIMYAEHPMDRLYWSRHGYFASAEYVETQS